MKKMDLIRIGNNVAEIWGGSCIDAWETKIGVEFLCVEHGERFLTELKNEDLAEYDF